MAGFDLRADDCSKQLVATILLSFRSVNVVQAFVGKTIHVDRVGALGRLGVNQGLANDLPLESCPALFNATNANRCCRAVHRPVPAKREKLLQWKFFTTTIAWLSRSNCAYRMDFRSGDTAKP
jgi:hypothetical protein